MNPFCQSREALLITLVDDGVVVPQVLVPCCGSITLSAYTASQFETYVLHPSGEGYQTIDGKVRSICQRYSSCCIIGATIQNIMQFHFLYTTGGWWHLNWGGQACGKG
jgi:hypothetical protein